MNRKGLQAIAKLRIKEAKVLLDNSCFQGAYYLAGYAVECALKACIAKQTRQHDFPDRKIVNDSYTHDLEKLLNVSGLKIHHQSQMASDPIFASNWAVVKDWSEETRYNQAITDIEAKDLYAAITQQKHGVLRWLKQWW
jgi:HEPN domain-containing protein